MAYMSTDNPKNNQSNPKKKNGSNIAGLVTHLQRVETKGARAKANKTGMRDGAGRRIEFSEGHGQQNKVIRGVNKSSNISKDKDS